MTKLFISDLHLQAARPDISERFFRFLETEAAEAEALYILGDLFEAWIGDDDPDEHNREVQAALRRLTDAGVAGYFMHGNRDFLIGEAFAERTGFTLLEDPAVHDLYGTPVLLSHGDAYCTDDLEYQAFRRQSRDPAWQQQVLSMSVEQRQALAGQAREESRAATPTALQCTNWTWTAPPPPASSSATGTSRAPCCTGPRKAPTTAGKSCRRAFRPDLMWEGLQARLLSFLAALRGYPSCSRQKVAAMDTPA